METEEHEQATTVRSADLSDPGDHENHDHGELLVIIPAFNEALNIVAVLKEVAGGVPNAGILVVSDGSEDETAERARENGVCVLELPYNLGVGGAMRAGFLYALEHGYSWAVQCDADGQHVAGEIHKLQSKAYETRADIVIGSRFGSSHGYAVGRPRRLAMRILGTILSRICRTTISDPTSGFKLMSSRAIQLFAKDYPSEYLGDTIEALVIAARAKLVVRETEVEMRPRIAGRPSHNPLQSGLFLVRAVFAMAVALTRPPASEAVQ